jgi:hypothetical protein
MKNPTPIAKTAITAMIAPATAPPWEEDDPEEFDFGFVLIGVAVALLKPVD